MGTKNWLYFDFDDVLAHRALSRSILVGERLGIEPSLARAFYVHGYKGVLQLANQSKAILSFNDEVSFYAAVFGHLSERFGRKHDHQDLIDLAVEFVSVPFELFPGVIESLRSLQDRYELGILSDAHPTRRAAELTYLGLLPFFRVVLISGEVGFDKSEPEFFAQAIVAAQTEAKHLQLIDNSPEPLCISLSCGFTKGVLIGHELSDDWETDQTVEALTTRLLIKRP